MKINIVILSLVMTLFFSACAQKEVTPPSKKSFDAGGLVYIYVKHTDEKYRVYINNEDTKIVLHPNQKTLFGIPEGKTNIQLVKGRETASIDIFINKSNEYYLKVMFDERGKIALLQVPKSAILSSVKTSPLYVDERAYNDTGDEEDGAFSIVPDFTKEVPEPKTPQNGETIFFYELDDGE